MAHQHDHRASRQVTASRLRVVLALVCAYAVAEIVGGLVSGSLALLADAGHTLSDTGALALALFAIRVAARPRTPDRSFGSHRTEILAALVNGAVLLAIAIFIFVEAIGRLRQPPEVTGSLMVAVALGGLLVNLLGMWLLRHDRHESLNVRGAWLHVATDALGSLQTIVAGFLVWGFGWRWADPVAALLIAGLILWSAWALLKDAGHVLMEGTPRHIDSDEVARALAGIEGVRDVHDLHVWTITSGFESLSVHCRVEGRPRDAVLAEVRQLLSRRFGIGHSTVQLEGPAGCAPGGCEDTVTA